jgi:hypothetical protein
LEGARIGQESLIRQAIGMNLCNVLEGEILFSALYGVYSLAFTELKKYSKRVRIRK